MDDSYLAHHGIKGMHWGVRRYQNKDGTLTNKGKVKVKANRKKRRKFLTDKDKRELLTAAGILAAYGGATAYTVHRAKKEQEAWDREYEHARDAYERANKAWEDFNRNRSRYRGNYTNTKANTANNKSKDRAKKYSGQKLDYATEKRKLSDLRKKVAKAQQDGTLTSDLVDQLQEQKARYQAASKQAAHSGIWVKNRSRDSLMHDAFGGIRYRVTRYRRY